MFLYQGRIMTKTEFLKLAESKWDELKELESETSFYDYEKRFDEIWVDYGRKALENSISSPGEDRRKKKDLKADTA